MKRDQKHYMLNLGKKISKQEFELDDTKHEFSEKYLQDKHSLLINISVKDNNNKTKQRKFFIVVACFVLLCLPVSAFAANQVINNIKVNKEQTDKYAYDYKFEDESNEQTNATKSDLYHTNVKFQFGYIPEGYKQTQQNSNKFAYNGSWNSNQNISICLNKVSDKLKLSFTNVLETKDMAIGNNDASFLLLNSTDKQRFNKILLVFYNDYGYTLQIFAQNAVPDDEIIKLAQNLQLVPCDESEAVRLVDVANLNSTAPVVSNTAQTTPSKLVDDSKFLNMSDTISGLDITHYSSSNLIFTVQNVEIRDSIKGLDVSGFGYSYEDIKQYIDADGNLQPYIEKQIEKGNGTTSLDSIIGETSNNLKLVYVTMKVKNTSDNVINSIKITPQICCLDTIDGKLSLPLNNIYTTNTVGREGWSVYCNRKTAYAENPNTSDKQFSIQRVNIQPQEEFEYNVAYIVDETRMNHMVLFFNPEGKISTIEGKAQTIIKLYN